MPRMLAARRKNRGRQAILIDALEPRQLLATLPGTSLADTFVVSRSEDESQIFVDQTTSGVTTRHTYDRATTSSLAINADAGDDRLVYHTYAALLRAFGDAVDMLKADEIDRWADGLVPKVDQMTFERVEHPTATGPAIAIKVTSKRDAPAGLPLGTKRQINFVNNSSDYFKVWWVSGGIISRDKQSVYGDAANKEYIAIVIPLKKSDLPDGRQSNGYFPSFAVTELFGTYDEQQRVFTPDQNELRRGQVHFMIKEA